MRSGGDRTFGSGAVAILLGAAMWGMLGPTYAKIQDWVAIDEVTLVTLRAIGGAVVCLVWLGLRDREALAVRRSDVAHMAVFGLITVTVFYLVLIYAFQYSSVAVGTLLLYLAPALVTIGAALWLNDPLSRVKIAALMLSFAGCLLVVEAFRPANLRADVVGVLFGLASAATYGCYSLMAKRLMRRYPPRTLLAWYLSTGALGLLAVKLAISPTAWPSPVETAGITAWCGVMVTVLPVALYTTGLSRIPASEASIIATVEPVVAMVLAWTVLGERLGPAQLLGAVFIIGGVVLLATLGRRTTRARLTGPRGGPETSARVRD